MASKYISGLFLVLTCCTLALGAHPETPDYKMGGMVWPMPSKFSQTQNQYTISPATFKITTTGQTNQILGRAIVRYGPLIFPVALNGHRQKYSNMDQLMSLSVNVAVATPTDQIQFGTDESYMLTVAASGASIVANTVFGAIRGLETFSQLVVHNESTYTIYETTIQDAPRFPWRGLLIDTSRHWLPLKTIYETISAMSYSKMNTLHWHIIDGQSFPYESKVYPMLSQEGAYRPDQVYTQEDMKAVVSFANDHGVRVVPEFDMPAHASSWGFGYDYMTIKCHSRRDPYDFNDGWGDDPMDPTNPNVYQFVETLLTEATTIFPDNWLHLGGDEIEYQCWNIPSINNYMKQHNITSYNQLEAIFITQINTFIKANLHKNMIYWQEVFQETTPFIGTAVDIWKDAATLSNVINKGINAIQSFGWYLDNLGATWLTFYHEDPIPTNTPPEIAKLILGGEASMWAETVDFTNIHQKVWPRAAAVAERLWSPASVTNEITAIPRLSQHRCRYVLRGIPAEPFQPGPGCY